ncbi:MAG: MFS transporter [Pseudomonadota bacterium]
MTSAKRRFLYLTGLIIAGEAIFALPFHVTRFFRPTVLEVFGLTATELGAAQGLYGITAMVAYFLGGPLADRFPAHTLLASSLWATALGGVYMATFPTYSGALALWGFFGFSTILLFWAAMIKATRQWGGEHEQGKAYGFLDGGRGLLAAALASVGVALLAFALPDGGSAATIEEKRAVLRTIIYGYTAVTLLAGVLVWFIVRPTSGEAAFSHTPPLAGISAALALPTVWLQAIIVLCAYVGYKGFDNYSLFAVQVYGLTDTEAAGLVTLGSWVRIVAAIGAGLIGDRIGASKTLIVLFALLLLADLYFALTVPGAEWVLIGNVLLTCIAIFGFRGLYFALFQEARVPLPITGTAIGIVSVVGYTPDIFVTFVAGVLIDRSPGLAGHQHFFVFLAAFALVGLIASTLFHRKVR